MAQGPHYGPPILMAGGFSSGTGLAVPQSR